MNAIETETTIGSVPSAAHRKALQFHVTIDVPAAFVPGIDQAEALRRVIAANLYQALTDPGALFTRTIPGGANVTVTEEAR